MKASNSNCFLSQSQLPRTVFTISSVRNNLLFRVQATDCDGSDVNRLILEYFVFNRTLSNNIFRCNDIYVGKTFFRLLAFNSHFDYSSFRLVNCLKQNDYSHGLDSVIRTVVSFDDRKLLLTSLLHIVRGIICNYVKCTR